MFEYAAILLTWGVFSALCHASGWPTYWALIPLLALAIPTLVGGVSTAAYVPSDMESVRRMLDLADIKPGERVIDLGCGDGRIVREAARRGAKAEGVEASVFLYLWARLLKTPNVKLGSLWRSDLSGADVVIAYLSRRAMAHFERELWPTLKPGCRVIAQVFPLPTLTPSRREGVYYRYDKSVDHSPLSLDESSPLSGDSRGGRGPRGPLSSPS